MSVKSTLAKVISLSALIFLPLSLPVNAQSAPAVIPGKQCIYNNGAFSLNVDWYNPGQVIFNGKYPQEEKDYTKYTVNGKPFESRKNLTLGNSSCTDGANRVAVVRIVGYNIANNAIVIAAGTITGIATSVAGAFVCAGSAGAGCVTLAVVGPATGGVIAAVGEALPEVKEIAYIGSPGTKNYVDLSGTIWQVGLANNIPLNNSRGFNRIATFFTGGEPGPRSITFKNEAGYVAEMVVMYFQRQDLGGGNIVELPVTKSSGQVSVGLTRHIDIPLAISNRPISVFIQGVATVKKDIFGTTVPANFSGNFCYKAFGTIFDAKGSRC